MTEEKPFRFHYAWVIFACCVLLRLGIGGVVGCLAGNFVTPIVKDLGSSVSAFTLFVSVEAAAMALFYTTASKMLIKRRINLVIGFASLLEVIGIVLMSVYRTAFGFNFSGLLLGIGSAFTGFVAIPIIINMWFKKKVGIVLGVIMASGYVATVCYSLLSAWLIDSFGWRVAYLILGAIAFIITVPVAFLFIKTPKDVGCEPYGASTEIETNVVRITDDWGLTRKQAIRTPVFYMVWITCMLYSISNSVAGYIATYSTMELQQSISSGAKATMCYHLGCAGCSIIIGIINDKWGIRAGLTWGSAFACAGYSVMVLSLNNPKLLIPAVLLVGLGGSMYTVQSPLLVKNVLGSKYYPTIWSVIMIGNSLAGAFSYSPIGLFYDIGKSYRGAFIFALSLFISAFVLGSITISLAKKYRRISMN